MKFGFVVPWGDAEDIGDLAAAAEDAGLIGFRGEEIDLTEGIQEQLVLGLPMRPLCREDCKGLCAACGADLNVDECNCRQQHPASPFAALRHLRLGKG